MAQKPKIIRTKGKEKLRDAEFWLRFNKCLSISTASEIDDVLYTILLSYDGREYDPQQHACVLSWGLFVARGDVDVYDAGEFARRTVAKLKIMDAELREIIGNNGSRLALWMVGEAQRLVTETT